MTTSTHGYTILHTASEVHGTGAGITTLGTAVRSIGTHGHIPHTGITAGTTRSISEAGMTLGTTATEDGMEVGTTHITDTCTLTTADGTADGTHTGATTHIITILSTSRMITGTDQDTAPAPTGSSQAGYLQEAVSLQPAGQEDQPAYRQHPEHRLQATRL